MKQFKLFGVLCFTVALIRVLVLNLLFSGSGQEIARDVIGYSMIALGFVFFLLSALNAKGVSKFARVMQFVVMGSFVLSVSYGVFYRSMTQNLIESGDYDTLSIYGIISNVLGFMMTICTWIFLFASRVRIVWKVLIPIFDVIEYCFAFWGFNLMHYSAGYSIEMYGIVSSVVYALPILFWLLAFATYPSKYLNK